MYHKSLEDPICPLAYMLQSGRNLRENHSLSIVLHSIDLFFPFPYCVTFSFVTNCKGWSRRITQKHPSALKSIDVAPRNKLLHVSAQQIALL